MATAKKEIVYTDELMSQINPEILISTAADVAAVQNGYSLSERIWIQIADTFVSNCNNAIFDPINHEYYVKKFKVDDKSTLFGWCGFMYSAYPKAIIEIIRGGDGSNIINISQVEMMKFNEAFKDCRSPEERRDLVDVIIQTYIIW